MQDIFVAYHHEKRENESKDFRFYCAKGKGPTKDLESLKASIETKKK